jgi:anaerobic ribonucleoside-triphosphate reductase activating protein
MRLAQIVSCTEAEGPGRRFAVWLQGCPLACPGCCNPEMQPRDGGAERSVDELADALRTARDRFGLDGLTLTGGEPFAQAGEAAELAEHARRVGLGVMAFSGYTRAELVEEPAAAALLAACDLLVDGPFERARPEPRRRWIGSANQELHFLSSRHDPSDPRFLLPNSVEIRLRRGAIEVNGWPGVLELQPRGTARQLRRGTR